MRLNPYDSIVRFMLIIVKIVRFCRNNKRSNGKSPLKSDRPRLQIELPIISDVKAAYRREHFWKEQ